MKLMLTLLLLALPTTLCKFQHCHFVTFECKGPQVAVVLKCCIGKAESVNQAKNDASPQVTLQGVAWVLMPTPAALDPAGVLSNIWIKHARLLHSLNPMSL